MRKKQHFPALLLLICTLFASLNVSAQLIPDAELTRRQSQQSVEAQARLNNSPNVFTGTSNQAGSGFVLPVEKPCFILRSIDWSGADSFSWLQSASQMLLNQCVGAKGLRAMQDYLQRQLVVRGFITSRIIVPEQNLLAGHLQLALLAGHLSDIREEGSVPGWAWMAIPHYRGAILNQRDLDQGLENIRRLTSQQGVEFDIVPGSVPGASELVIRHPQSKFWSGMITLDDSGAESTGKYQVGGILTLDSLLHAYDSLTLTVNHNANFSSSTVGSASSSLNWTVPFGYWSVLAGANFSKYKQTVAGFSGDIVYSGRSRGVEVGLGYVLYRDANSKLSTQFKLNRKVSQSYVDDAEINVQFRDVQGYDSNLTYRYFFGHAMLDVALGIKGSMPAQSKAPGLIVGEPDWDGHYRITTISTTLNTAFTIGKQNVHYQGNLRMQHASRLLPTFEFMSIGNRYSVRGFDGASSLSSESGWQWRNDFGFTLPQFGKLPPLGEVYLGIDTARLSGKNASSLLGNSLTGAALGWRGRYARYSYDFTVGMPIQRPAGFVAKTPTMTAFVSADF